MIKPGSQPLFQLKKALSNLAKVPFLSNESKAHFQSRKMNYLY